MDKELLRDWLTAKDNHLAYLAYVAEEEQLNADCPPEIIPF